MKNKLMYGEDTAKDWYSTGGACKAKDVERPDNNTKRENAGEPKVSIPSPFARFELVQKAFSNFYSLGATECDTRDRILISHTLDLLELFYESPAEMSIVQWVKSDAVSELMNSPHRGNNLFGAALDQYSRQENYGFQDKNVVVSIIKYGADVIGCTSPTSILLATPRYAKFQNIKVGGAKNMFESTPRMLFARDEAFVEYVYRMTSQYLDNEPLEAFIGYLTKMKEIIRQKNPALYATIATFPDASLANQLDTLYERVPGVTLYKNHAGEDLCLYSRKKESVAAQIENSSDFILQGAKNGQKPMVLTNKCPYAGLKYTSKNEPWSIKSHKIDYSATLNVAKRASMPVPGTGVEYPWLCENDLLSDVIVQLPYKVDNVHFFYGDTANAVSDCGFLLPLKPAFFKYFDANYLCGFNGNTKNYEIQVFRDSRSKEVEKVVVKLSLQITGGKPLTLQKTYFTAASANDALNGASGLSTKYPDEAVGYILECPLAISIFPFARLKDNNLYRVMLERATADLGDFQMSLIPRKCEANKEDSTLEWQTEFKRTENTTYYSLEDSFDYFSIEFKANEWRRHMATCIPVWPDVHLGTKDINFAFDFGTTNSHIAIKDGTQFVDFKLDKTIVSTLKTADKDNISSTLLDVWARQEFLPKQIGTAYKFPLRSVVLKPHKLDLDSNTPSALQHVNIPFIYGKEDYNAALNEPKPNLKWSNKGNAETQKKLANAFIEEMLFLSRAFAIEYGADLKKTHITWTYPLSMRATKRMHDEVWVPTYIKYFNPGMSSDDAADHVFMVTESIAPLMYYSEEDKMQSADMEMSVDIGGGTCDVVIKNGNDDIKINSFRFAADVIFNAGKAHENQMVQYWSKKLTSALKDKLDPKYIKLLESVCAGQQPSSEANSLLFALESLPELAKLPEADRSYNMKLKTDDERKVLFLYFYGSIIYYLSKLLKNQGAPRPGTIYFSGTGSKLLNIIGSKSVLQDLTTKMIECFGGFSYGGDEIRIIVEAKEPKQLTAKGALAVSGSYQKPTTALIVKKFDKQDKLRDNTLYYSVTKKMELTYADLKNETILREVIDSVNEFNRLFIELADKLDFEEEYGCSRSSLDELQKRMGRDLLISLKSEINEFPDSDKPEDVLCESLFFYPVKNIIQKQLIAE